MRRLAFLLLLLVAGLACTLRDNVATSSSALDLPNPTPVPIESEGQQPEWDGTTSELFFADAWASCSFVAVQTSGPAGDSSYIRDGHARDFYLDYIYDKMDASVCNGVYGTDSNVVRRWYHQRTDASCNADPSTIGTSSVNAYAATLDQVAVPGLMTATTTIYSTEQDEADAIIRSAGINYCIAQHLRQIAPGSAGVGALTMTSDDQRQLLELIRERSQLAMLSDARLLVLATTPASGSPTQPLQYVQQWFNDDTNNQNAVKEVADSLAAAAQMLSITGTELTTLLGRSSSARTPRGGGPSLTQLDDIWGSGSWRSRALALLYGGDPLDNTVMDQYGNSGLDTTVPWKHFSVENTRFETIPHVSTDVRAPQVQELFRLARQFDAFNLKKETTTDASGCYGVDLPSSSSRLYRAVEAGLETANCDVFINNNQCQTITPESLPAPASNFESMVLWQRYRVDPDNADTLVSMLADEVGRECEWINLGNESMNPYESDGAMNVLGAESILTLTGVDAGDYYHIDSAANFVAKFDLQQHEGLFAKNGGYGISTIVFPTADPEAQGFYWDSPAIDLDSWRLAGIVQSLGALRESFFQANAQATQNTLSKNVQLLLARSTDLMNLVGSAVGNTSVFLEQPANTITQSGSFISINGSPSLVVYAPEGDTFWDPTNPTFQVQAFSATQIPTTNAFDTTGLIPKIFLDTSATTFTGFDFASAQTELLGSSPSTLPTLVDGLRTRLYRWVFPNVTNPAATYVALKFGANGPEYQVLIGNALGQANNSNLPTLSAGYGGQLNDSATKLLTVQTDNPAQPQYDGFGLSVRWSPPTDPTLIGGTAGSSSTSTYLQDAQTASDAAVAAVTIAFQTLLAETQTALDQNTKIAQSEQVSTAAKAGLCGESNPDCASCKDTDPTCPTAVVSIPFISASPSDPLRQDAMKLAQGCTNGDALGCAASTMFKQFDVPISLDQIVAQAIGGQVAPTFDAYKGGSLQASFIQQWVAYTGVENELVKLFDTANTASARQSAADTALQAANAKQQDQCDAAAFVEAFVASNTASGGFPAGASVSFNPGPIFAQMHACQNAIADLDVAKAQPILAYMQGISDFGDEAVNLANAGGLVQTTLAQSNALNEQAKLTQDQANLDIELAQDDQLTNTALYRTYHEYDVWRAQALVENARLYAVTARRAIESRYVVDMSLMSQPEPFVASPSLWADQIYEYDLNMPAAVGLSIAPTQTTGSIYPNVVSDYVGNLQRFVNGFVVARPTASTQSDSDVVSLPGPAGLEEGNGGLPPGTIDASSYKWTFYCPDTASWAVIPDSGDVDAVCGTGTPPTLANLDFALDPWARVDGSVADDPYNDRYNERWGRGALNLVGTAILDCTKAADPLSCYAESFVPFDLTHNGPAWVTDYDESWQWLGVTTGQIEGGKALAAEQWLDPLSNGWSQPYVTAVARTEFEERPFGGAYSLTLHLGPEVTLSRIERLQLLVEEAYWVKQQ